MARVLIVDDDKFTRSVLESIFAQDPVLRGLDVEVITAEDGERGLALFDEHRPQVVIADLLMPKKDGFALCEAIRTRHEGDAVHLVVMSGVYRDPTTSRRLHEQLGARLFHKPYQLRNLTRHVAELLGGKQSAIERLETEPPVRAARSPRVGRLGERSLAAVLLDLFEGQATGRLSLRRGKVHKEIGLVVGHPASVTSNVRSETLGHLLLARGVIDDRQHRLALERASQRKERFGAALIAIGALDPEALVEQLTAQVRFKIRSALRWSDGTWSFEPSDAVPRGAHGNALDMIEVVLVGLRESAVVSPLPERVSELFGRPLELTPRGRALLPAIRAHVSQSFAEVWSPGVTAESLATLGVERTALIVVLDVLTLCDAVSAGDGAPVAASDPSETEPVTLEDLSRHQDRARDQNPVEKRQSATSAGSGERKTERLYSALFGDALPASPQLSGALPVDLDEAGPDGSPTGSAPATGEERSGRRRLLEEYLRVQAVSHYQVLRVEPGADPATIAAAVAERRSSFSYDFFARFDLGRDYAKLEELHGVYERAAEVLLDDDRRAAYDAELAGRALPPRSPDLEAEIAYSAAEELLSKGSYPAAIARLGQAIRATPNEAAYHALLGWTHYLAGSRSPRAADQARPHINQALAIDPDHAGAHEHKGIIAAELAVDLAEAEFHLEQALRHDPERLQALDALEALYRRRADLLPLVRQLRRILYRIAGKNAARESELWKKVLSIYRELGDRDSALIACRAVLRLAPDDERARAALDELEGGGDAAGERKRELVEEWLADLSRPEPGLALLALGLAAEQPDAAFVAASALVARGAADQRAEELYRRYRPRFVVRSQRAVDGQLWGRLAHEDDSPEIGELFALLEPLVLRVAPLEFAESELGEAIPVDEGSLPESFVRTRAYVAHVLGVKEPPVRARPDFGRQIHVAASEPPVLLAGDDAIATPERSELAFRLGRAMSYLRPGRALAGAYPARFLKQVVLAAYAAVGGASVEDPDGTIARLAGPIRELPADSLAAVQRLVGSITRTPTLNLTRWTRALARTGDRVGLLLCGDLPGAIRFARDGGSPEAERDLLRFALGSRFLALRRDTGLAIDV